MNHQDHRLSRRLHRRCRDHSCFRRNKRRGDGPRYRYIQCIHCQKKCEQVIGMVGGNKAYLAVSLQILLFFTRTLCLGWRGWERTVHSLSGKAESDESGGENKPAWFRSSPPKFNKTLREVWWENGNGSAITQGKVRRAVVMEADEKSMDQRPVLQQEPRTRNINLYVDTGVLVVAQQDIYNIRFYQTMIF
jgi:hypothetical protein